MVDTPNNQPLVTPNPGELMEMDCARCKGKFFVKIPPIDVVNRTIYSIMVIPHTEAQCCSHCGQAHQYMLVAVGMIQSKWVPVEDKSAAQIIQVPPGTKIPPMRM